MRIATNTISDAMVRQIQLLTGEQSTLQMQVATGRRITKPEDDPAAVGRVLNFQSQERQVTQYSANADRALELAQTSYSGLQGLKKISDRAGELVTLGTGSLGPDAMSAYATETDQLIEQAVQLANSQSGGDYVYGGTAVSAPPFSVTRDINGSITAVTYVGNSTQAAIPLSDASSVTPSTSGATNTGIGDFITHLIELRDALNSGSTSAVSAVQPGLMTGEDTIISAMADNGGIQTRIEAAQAQQKDRTTSLASLVSNESSVDLPSTIVKLNQTTTAYQAALSSAAKIMNLSLLDYLK